MQSTPSTLLVAGLAFLTVLTGCGPGDPPDPHAAHIVEARTAEADGIDRALDEVTRALGDETLATSVIDQCYEGQRNWKVDTGYSFRCSLRMGRLVGFDGDFRARMLDLDTDLMALGWESDNGEWPGQLADSYWHMRLAESESGQVSIDRLPGPFGIFRDKIKLSVDYGSPLQERGLERMDRAQQSSTWCCGVPFHSASELIDFTEADEWPEHLVLITVVGHYWER